jgi:hypothetical protein
MVCAPDLIRQILDIAAGKLRIDAGAAGVLKLNLGSLQINHDIPLPLTVGRGAFQRGTRSELTTP